MKLNLSQLAKMCGGKLSIGSNPDLIIDNVIIDSRGSRDGSLFVAISGDKQDGHAFVIDSLSRFKMAALVIRSNLDRLEQSKKFIDIPNLIYVEDTIKALGLLGSNYRKQFQIPIVGITGSNGKTTVKEMLKLICEYQFGAAHVLATSGNLNNHLGVPLTLLELNQNHQVAIVEMGMNHAGELDYLSKLALPTIAVVNNVMLAHAGFFNGIEDIAKAKAEIYHGLLAGGIACINAKEPLHSIFEAHIKSDVRRFYYGKTDCYIKNTNADGEMFVVTPIGDISVKLKVLGEHNQKNALTVIALALNFGCSLENIKQGLSSYQGFKGRLEKKTAFNGALIIDDSYNANPESVKAAVLAIKELPKPHWFVFADLKELGKFEVDAHKEIGRFASANGIDVFLSIGELAAIADKEFLGTKLHFAGNLDIVKYCRENLPNSATILIKGSNSMNLREVVNSLLK